MKVITFFKGVLFVALCLVISLVDVASTRADYLYTGAVSYHISPTSEVNNSNHNLLAYERNNIVVGVMNNSFSEPTVMAGYSVARESENWSFAIIYGASYGYRQCFAKEPGEKGAGSYFNDDKRACLAVIPALTFKKYKVQPTLMVFGNAVALSIKWDLE